MPDTQLELFGPITSNCQYILDKKLKFAVLDTAGWIDCFHKHGGNFATRTRLWTSKETLLSLGYMVIKPARPVFAKTIAKRAILPNINTKQYIPGL